MCSDKTVGLKNDSVDIDKSELGFRVDTDPEMVRRFLRRETDDIKVIFSTYHSTEVVAKGAEGLPPIDFGSRSRCQSGGRAWRSIIDTQPPKYLSRISSTAGKAMAGANAGGPAWCTKEKGRPESGIVFRRVA